MESYIEFAISIHNALELSKNSIKLKSALRKIDDAYQVALSDTNHLKERAALGVIYMLVDNYFDALEHGFNEVSTEYSCEDAKIDIQNAIFLLNNHTDGSLHNNKIENISLKLK